MFPAKAERVAWTKSPAASLATGWNTSVRATKKRNRIDLTLAPFVLSMAITLAIAWAAVIGVVVKAASVRLAEVLRHA